MKGIGTVLPTVADAAEPVSNEDAARKISVTNAIDVRTEQPACIHNEGSDVPVEDHGFKLLLEKGVGTEPVAIDVATERTDQSTTSHSDGSHVSAKDTGCQLHKIDDCPSFSLGFSQDDEDAASDTKSSGGSVHQYDQVFFVYIFIHFFKILYTK